MKPSASPHKSISAIVGFFQCHLMTTAKGATAFYTWTWTNNSSPQYRMLLKKCDCTWCAARYASEYVFETANIYMLSQSELFPIHNSLSCNLDECRKEDNALHTCNGYCHLEQLQCGCSGVGLCYIALLHPC